MRYSDIHFTMVLDALYEVHQTNRRQIEATHFHESYNVINDRYSEMYQTLNT